MSTNHDMWIAPKRNGGYWTVSDWQQLNLDQSDSGDWETAIQIFEDRIKFRFVDAIETLKQKDDEYYAHYKTRRFGFAAVALMALLIETLAQFYAGEKESTGKNKTFYTEFLYQNSLVLKCHFKSLTATIFYDTIRCGILHQAETKEDSLIRYRKDDDINYQIPFEPQNEHSLIVYWAALFNLLKQEIAEYTDTLRLGKDQDRRNKFKTKMDFICHLSNP